MNLDEALRDFAQALTAGYLAPSVADPIHGWKPPYNGVQVRAVRRDEVELDLRRPAPNRPHRMRRMRESARGRDARLRAAREVVVSRCFAALGSEPPATPSVGAVVRLAADAPSRPARRACAVLLVHALAVPSLVPPASAGDICGLMEGALRDVLLRCGYPFGGTIEEKMLVLERLHTTIGELMQPLEPTFPNWQGLYAG